MSETTADSRQAADGVRRILLLAHTGREGAISVARQTISALRAHGLIVRVLAEEAADLGVEAAPDLELVAETEAVAGCELVVVLGGDGTNRAVTWTPQSGEGNVVPLPPGAVSSRFNGAGGQRYVGSVVFNGLPGEPGSAMCR